MYQNVILYPCAGRTKPIWIWRSKEAAQDCRQYENVIFGYAYIYNEQLRGIPQAHTQYTARFASTTILGVSVTPTMSNIAYIPAKRSSLLPEALWTFPYFLIFSMYIVTSYFFILFWRCYCKWKRDAVFGYRWMQHIDLYVLVLEVLLDRREMYTRILCTFLCVRVLHTVWMIFYIWIAVVMALCI